MSPLILFLDKYPNVLNIIGKWSLEVRGQTLEMAALQSGGMEAQKLRVQGLLTLGAE